MASNRFGPGTAENIRRTVTAMWRAIGYSNLPVSKTKRTDLQAYESDKAHEPFSLSFNF